MTDSPESFEEIEKNRKELWKQFRQSRQYPEKLITIGDVERYNYNNLINVLKGLKISNKELEDVHGRYEEVMERAKILLQDYKNNFTPLKPRRLENEEDLIINARGNLSSQSKEAAIESCKPVREAIKQTADLYKKIYFMSQENPEISEVIDEHFPYMKRTGGFGTNATTFSGIALDFIAKHEPYEQKGPRF